MVRIRIRFHVYPDPRWPNTEPTIYGTVQSWYLTYDIGDDEVYVDGDDQKGEEGGKNPRNHTVREIPHNPAQ